MNYLKKIFAALFLSTLFVTPLMAQQPTMQMQQGQQTEVTDSELKAFAEVMPEVQSTQQEFNQKMVQAVQENELDVNRFNQLAQASQDPNQEVDASSEEMENFQSAMQAVQEIQGKLQSEIQSTIEDAGMTMNRYQQIAMAVNQDQELQQKLQGMMQQEGNQ